MPKAEPAKRQAKRKDRRSKASERLQRLLVVVPYVVQHPGVEISELTSLFGITEAELARDLNLLFMSGLPPYGPGDLIDVRIEEGRVWIDMADHFARPVRLTRNEALALYLHGTALVATPGLAEAPALASALAKLETELGDDALGGLAGRVEAAESLAPGETLEAIRAAAEGHERVDIEYYSASRAETTVRTIDPEQVFAAIGNWYIVAWDSLSQAERIFRSDRVKRARSTGERFEPRGLLGAGRALYTPTGQDVAVRLLLGPGARWVAEYYPTEDPAERGGDLEVTLRTSRLEWLARMLLRLGSEARVLHPPELAERVRDQAGEALTRY